MNVVSVLLYILTLIARKEIHLDVMKVLLVAILKQQRTATNAVRLRKKMAELGLNFHQFILYSNAE